MALKDTELGEILLAQSYVSEEELSAAQKSAKDRKVNLFTVLLEKGLLTQSLYEQALAEHYKLPFYDIAENPPNPELMAKLPEDIARTYHAIVVKQAGKTITVATSEPGEATLEEAIRLNFEKEEAIIPEQETKEKKNKRQKTNPKRRRNPEDYSPQRKQTQPKIFPARSSLSLRHRKTSMLPCITFANLWQRVSSRSSSSKVKSLRKS